MNSAGFRIMGVVNVTPDSFSDGGQYLDAAAAIAHGLELEADGAAILDVGGESTRPGAAPVAEDEELRRVIPVIEGLIAAGCPAQISIDTSKAGWRHGRSRPARRSSTTSPPSGAIRRSLPWWRRRKPSAA